MVALKAQYNIAQGKQRDALGTANQNQNTPCKGKRLQLFGFQLFCCPFRATFIVSDFPQGGALGYMLLPLRDAF